MAILILKMKNSCCFPSFYVLSLPKHNHRIILPGSCNDLTLFNNFLLIWTCLQQRKKKIASIQDVSFVCFDVTDLKIIKYGGLKVQEEDIQEQISIFLFIGVSPLTIK